MDHHGAKDDLLLPRKRARVQDNPPSAKDNALDLIGDLPDECILEIFAFLPSYRDRCSCAAVSKKWLALQAHMGGTDFKRSASDQQPPCTNKTTSRCLEGMKANDTRLAAIAVGIQPSRGLTQLCIRGTGPSHGVTDLGLKIIAQAFPGLKSLSLWDCLKVGSEGLALIAQSCKWLEKLDILNSPLIDDNGLVAIANNCPNLSILNLDSCPLISNCSLQAIARHSTNIITISFIKCSSISSEGIISIISRSPKLAKLKLVSVDATDGVLEAIGRHGRSLRSLCLENIWGVTEMGFHSIGRLEKVEFLSLKSCSGLNDARFNTIGEGFARLRKVAIRKCEALTDKGLRELFVSATLLECVKLVECDNVTSLGLMNIFKHGRMKLAALSLVKCRGLKEDDPNLRRAILSKCPLLESVTLDRCEGVGDTFLSWLGGATSEVKHLKLVGLSSVTDKGILSLIKTLEAPKKALVSVDLKGCLGITDWSVLAVASGFGDKLEILRLDGCHKLSDGSLKVIADYCLCLRELDLSRCRISDNGLLCLAKSKHQCIEVLSLECCSEITDNGLGFLEMMCGDLAGLNIKQCSRISRSGVKSFRETLWWCDLLY